jgi:hypothetical protein
MNDLVQKKDKPWLWKAGESGNVNGRPKGSRSAFSAAFIGDMQASWATHGASVLDVVARKDPSRFLGVCASIVPRDVALSIEQRLPGGLSSQDLAIFSAIKSSIPDANTRDPSEVLNYVLDAIRAHGAKTIEGE